VKFGPDGDVAYVANNGSGTVSVIDTATATRTADISVGDKPWGLEVHRTGTHVFVTLSNSQELRDFDTDADHGSYLANVGLNAYEIVEAPFGDEVYVVNYQDNKISVIPSKVWQGGQHTYPAGS